MIPRFIHHAYASVLGFFWLPCPVCGRCFGGHQIRMRGHTLITPDGNKFTCPRCPVEYRPIDINAGNWVVTLPTDIPHERVVEIQGLTTRGCLSTAPRP